MTEIRDPFEMMPRMHAGYPFREILDRIENPRDSRSIAAWVALVGGSIVAALGAAYGLLKILPAILTSDNALKLHDFVVANYLPFALILISVIVALACFGAVWLDHYKLAEKIRRADTLADCKVLQMITICQVISPLRVNFAHRYWIQARRHHVEYFEMDFVWTSALEGLQVRCRNPEHVPEIIKTKRPGVNRLRIRIPPLMKKYRDVVEFTFVTDSEGYALPEPLLGLAHTSNKFPRFNTFLGLLVEAPVAIASLYRERYFSPQVELPIERKAVELREKDFHLWPVTPKPGWKSMLRWVYEEAPMEHN